MRDTSVVRSSVMPSAKYSCSGSLLRLAKGSTTIDRRAAGIFRAAALSAGAAFGMAGPATCREAIRPEVVGPDHHPPPAPASASSVRAPTSPRPTPETPPAERHALQPARAYV